MCIDGIIII